MNWSKFIEIMRRGSRIFHAIPECNFHDIFHFILVRKLFPIFSVPLFTLIAYAKEREIAENNFFQAKSSKIVEAYFM